MQRPALRCRFVRSALLLVGFVLLAACTGDDSPDGLEVRRKDGSTIEFAGPLRAWCADGTVEMIYGRFPGESEASPPSYWLLGGEVETFRRNPRLELPEGKGGFLYVYDAETDNELSSGEEGSSGSVEFDEVACERGETVRVTVEATLGSELEGRRSAEAVGDIEAVIGEPPERSD
jgi:hypothetical protein